MNKASLFNFAREHFYSEPEYLWNNLPDYAVLRHHNSDKWFGIIMSVPGKKLGLKTGDKVDILDVKVRPEHIGSLRNKEGVFPAYHMNKEHWVSVILSGPLTEKEIQELLADSYKLTS